MMPRSIEVVVMEPELQIDAESVVNCLQLLDTVDTYAAPDGSLAVAFLDEKSCCDLHRDFFSDPEPTDVMTFPGDAADQHAGDIAICPMIALHASQRENTRFEEELTLYLVHGWLHLAGLDDRDAGSIQRMRDAEKQLMDRLAAASRLLKATWRG